MEGSDRINTWVGARTQIIRLLHIYGAGKKQKGLPHHYFFVFSTRRQSPKKAKGMVPSRWMILGK